MLVQIASSFISIHMPEASKTILCIAVSRIGHECKNNIDHGCAAAVMASTPTSHSAIFLDSINSRLSNEYVSMCAMTFSRAVSVCHAVFALL